LIILDGQGIAPPGPGNAVTTAGTPALDALKARGSYREIAASGLAVGLPEGQMGNSEVGHTNLGAGRVVYQDLVRIDQLIADGELAGLPALRAALERAREGTLHLLGLCSDGKVHSSLDHLEALVDAAAEAGLKRVAVHALTDGRDTAPDSSPRFLRRIEDRMKQAGLGRIATVSGRYHAMDRDQRWDRTRRAFDALRHGEGERAESALEAVDLASERGETDEFISPTVIGDPAADRVRDGDVVVCFNFRPDRMRQISAAFMDPALRGAGGEFDGFDRRGTPRVHWVTLTRYEDSWTNPVIVEDEGVLADTFGERAAAAGLTQLRCAETEKYPHVTYFFSGGREAPYEGEERILVPSPKVATYDLQPAMSANGVADEAIGAAGRFDAVVLNFANPDMVGHTGVFDAVVEAVRTVDNCLERVAKAYLDRDYGLFVLADHGNAEVMIDPETGGPHTAHTTNPVPFVTVNVDPAASTNVEKLAEVAPLMARHLGLKW
jgi:2,3-bisphosphoglycerate-independent phosphoglycerate mutase